MATAFKTTLWKRGAVSMGEFAAIGLYSLNDDAINGSSLTRRAVGALAGPLGGCDTEPAFQTKSMGVAWACRPARRIATKVSGKMVKSS